MREPPRARGRRASCRGCWRSTGWRCTAASEVERFEGADGRVARVVTSGGLSIDTSCVVIGAGVQPDVLLARSAGLELGETGGFACSASLETSLPGVFAAGDVGGVGLAAARAGGARRALGGRRRAGRDRGARHARPRRATHDVVPYFWSDLSDWATLEYVGHRDRRRRSCAVRSTTATSRRSTWTTDGRVVGAATVGRSDDLEAREGDDRQERAAPDRAALADGDGPRGALARAASRAREVPGQGLEPQLPAPEAGVLPLDHPGPRGRSIASCTWRFDHGFSGTPPVRAVARDDQLRRSAQPPGP